ncbi:MAG TPA: hypothetical protein VFQ53_37435 [Kofleriaceae bacterium]|nr:hypothetical protein [Kofleriaceae bacterium]
MLRRAAIHAALLGAIWLAASAAYAVIFEGGRQLAWLAVDVAVVALAAWVVARDRELVGFRSLGPRRLAAIVAIALLAFGCVAIVQSVIEDGNGLWLDEREYLAMLREGAIRRGGLLPFSLRWLEPMLAGAWNILPVDDAPALKSVNFGALVMTSVLLVLALVRLGVSRALALASPVLLACSYLGVYSAENRLVLDPFNYALFVVLLHTLLHRAHRAYFAIALVVLACNSEKAVYWLPVLGVLALLESERTGWRRLGDAAKQVAVYGGPAVLYLVAMRLYLAGAPSDTHAFVGKLRVMAFTPLGAKTTDAGDTFVTLWFPFGGLTVYALLGLRHAPRPLQAAAVLALPILASTLVATDTERMVAYGFVVVLPLALVYLTAAYAAMPRVLAGTLLAFTVALAIAQHYLLPVARLLGDNVLSHNPARIRLAVAAIEILLVGTTVYLRETIYSRGASSSKPATF